MTDLPSSQHSSEPAHDTGSGLAADKSYARWFILLFIPLCLLVLIFKRTDIFPWIGSCSASGYDSEHYLAYCHTARFGDYEHYAFWHDTERLQIANLKAADVLFLGNSRTQFAFSTQAVADFFEQSQISYFVFGFGLGGKSPIPESLIKKYTLRPKAVVINADPFFSADPANTLIRAQENNRPTAWEHRAKIYLQEMQQQICNPNDAALTTALLCSGEVATLFRSRVNGFWKTDYYLPEANIPVSYSNSLIASLDERLELLDTFILNTGLPRECVILTVTPHTGTPLEFAKALSSKANLAGFFPELSSLGTIDDSHLNKASAERWSAAFLSLAQDDIKRCVGTD